MLELVLAEAEKKIGLVFAAIAAFAEDRTVFKMIDDGVVAGGDKVRPERPGLGAEVSKFEMFVAHHARIRRSTLTVFAGKIVDDNFFKVVCLVHNVVGDSQTMGHAAGIRYGRRSAAFVLCAGNAVLWPDFHRHADHFPSVALQ